MRLKKKVMENVRTNESKKRRIDECNGEYKEWWNEGIKNIIREKKKVGKNI